MAIDLIVFYTTKITELGNGPEFRCLCPTHFHNWNSDKHEILNIKLVAA